MWKDNLIKESEIIVYLYQKYVENGGDKTLLAFINEYVESEKVFKSEGVVCL